ncbi:tRNA (adenosine(37)-N6)-dimethylallyltransferase MiaA [Eubacterium sp. 1001713B170207_170306_E7]|uniref:tRNA (adenosine(37)-N6)-dimethylallyltransferase MiaA n=1 Tax=Eubacterium sp. 1001713B170207_170306_E7 TaxID=2787097 RepID=UPI001896B8BB|nr:tRNA (adenosine(37)-N6)-dimethylallyltransferase MiaA [Eubacterium sp. 1001713B170207_170306_E7]
MTKPKIAVLVGPTACGKTDTAVELAKKLGGEIISADSMQIYRQMTIGTAKPTEEEMQGVPHHLIDCVDPDEEYSVARFKAEALERIGEILSRGRQPIVAGGTGLYINGLTLPWGFREKDTDERVRERLAREVEEMGKEAFYERLKAVDPATATTLHPNNVKRMIRAYEIYEVTGKPKSSLDMEAAKEELPYDYVLLGISMDRARLYERINRRIDMMVRDGLVDEVKSLLDQGYTQDLLSMKAIGYKEFLPYLKGEMPLEEALRILKRDTRHFAKRQLTWFRKDQRIRWFEAEDYGSRAEMAEDMKACFLTY